MELVKRLLIIIIFLAFMITILSLPGCKTIEYVPVHTTDTVIVNNYIRDSIKERDSVFIFNSNDTLYVYREKVLYRDKIVVDTLKMIKYEEIPVEVEKIVEVERKFKWFEKFFIGFGLISLLSLFLFAFYKFKN